MRLLICIICFLGFSTFSKAQFNFGLQAGYTLAWQDYGNVILPEDAVIRINAFHAALAVEYQLKSPRYSILTEPSFIRRGAACVPGWNGGINPNPIFPADSRFLLDYVELPLLLQVNFFAAKGKLKLSPMLGYSSSVMLWGVEETIDLDTKDVIAKDKLNIGIGQFAQIQRVDHGARCGIKVATHIKNQTVYFRSMYYCGLPHVASGLASQNRSLDFGLGFQF